jgi:hypothetical protein
MDRVHVKGVRLDLFFFIVFLGEIGLVDHHDFIFYLTKPLPDPCKTIAGYLYVYNLL